MSTPYTYIASVAEEDIPRDGILSRTVHNDDHAKVVLFGFAANEELSEHTASTAAIVQIVRGQARLTLGDDTIEAAAGAWVYMPPQLRHSVRAATPLVMLLILLKHSS